MPVLLQSIRRIVGTSSCYARCITRQQQQIVGCAGRGASIAPSSLSEFHCPKSYVNVARAEAQPGLCPNSPTCSTVCQRASLELLLNWPWTVGVERVGCTVARRVESANAKWAYNRFCRLLTTPPIWGYFGRRLVQNDRQMVLYAAFYISLL